MCTLVVATRVWPQAPLLVAANRDERLDRPAAPPALRTDGPRPVLAPVDRLEGGTWLGLNDAGLFAGITNRFGHARAPGRRSRGLLVLDALAEADAAAGADRIAALRPADYNPFHLVVADRARAFLVWSDGARLRREELRPGIHVVTERSLGAGTSGRVPVLTAQVAALAADGLPAEPTLRAILAQHREPPIDATCVHVPELGYGTRSSTLLWLAPERGAVRWLHAEGPPCTTPYQDVSEAAGALLAGRP